MPGVRMCEPLVLQREVPAEGEPLPAWADAVGQVRAARADELTRDIAPGERSISAVRHRLRRLWVRSSAAIFSACPAV